MPFELTILGSSSATPTFNRHPTAQVLNIRERFFLIDCGEGTQKQLVRYKIRYNRIGHIFISHLHGDHYLGLIGLLSSLHLNGRTKPMYVFAPAALKEIIELQFKYSETELRYPLIFHPTNAEQSLQIFENSDIKVETIILSHRIPCTGFKFVQKKRLRKAIKEKVEALHIPKDAIPALKRGIDYVDAAGTIFKSSDLTSEADEPRSFAYCSDTICNWEYLENIKNVNTLYHEATFMNDMLERATETFHTTSLQAANVAKKAGAKQLIIGHFSARYRDLIPLLEESKSVFTNTQLAIEGQTFSL